MKTYWKRHKIWNVLHTREYIDRLIHKKRMDSLSFDVANDATDKDHFREELYRQFRSVVSSVLKEYSELGFENVPSVDNRNNEYLNASMLPRDPGSRECLENVTLMDHTLHVFEIASSIDLDDPIGRIPLLFAALFHDAGKSKELCKKYHLDVAMSHERKSGEYAFIRLKDTIFRGVGVNLRKFFKMSNKKAASTKFSTFGRYFFWADNLARKYEIDRCLKNEEYARGNLEKALDRIASGVDPFGETLNTVEEFS